MGFGRTSILALLLSLPLAAAGCQFNQPASNKKLIEHQSFIDFAGLETTQVIDELDVSYSAPRSWSAAPLKKTALYTHQQWRSPSGNTGTGVVRVHLPWPLSESSLLWLAKQEYTKKSQDGREVGRWEDELGRQWFETENNQYHVQGYVIARGFNAWFVYFGYKTASAPDVAELSLAARAVQTVVPQPGKSKPNIDPEAAKTLATTK